MKYVPTLFLALLVGCNIPTGACEAQDLCWEGGMEQECQLLGGTFTEEVSCDAQGYPVSCGPEQATDPTYVANAEDCPTE